jgi:endonuclease/exonuclease/phosphatase family metal-dependent hydrolase
MATFRIASFNVENLFSRAKILNLRDSEVINGKLALVDELNTLIHKPTNFTAAEKTRIVALYDELKEYVVIRENRGSKLFNQAKTQVKAKSGTAWEGELDFTRENFSKMARENTANVIKQTKAHIACIVEAEDRLSLKAFDTDLLNHRYPVEMLIDGNDPRSIDVGVFSKYPLASIRTHIFDKVGNTAVFSRDCPEYEIELPNGKSLFLLCNHLKSKGYDVSGTANQRRKRQATRVAEILADYDLATDWVVVAGDLNDTPDSDPLSPLMGVADLFNTLELQFPNEPEKRWTYAYDSAFNQIDYLLVSKPLKQAFVKASVERRGIYDLKKLTEDSQGTVNEVPVETPWPSVDHATNAASDHGAVWAEFTL